MRGEGRGKVQNRGEVGIQLSKAGWHLIILCKKGLTVQEGHQPHMHCMSLTHYKC